MAKDNLRQYDSTAANNSDVGGVNTAEGMLPSKVNDALREIMSHLSDFQSGTEGIDVLSLSDDDNSAQIKFQAPSAVTATVTFTFPDGDGSADQILKTNGSGTLSWVDQPSTNLVGDTTPQLGGNLDVQTHSIVSTSNQDINITPNGTGDVSLGNFTFDADQTVGSGQDDYLLTYNHTAGKISLEVATAPAGSAAKAWGRFDFDTSIPDSFNVSSYSDNGGGDGSMNYANNMSNANYAAFSSGASDNGNDTNLNIMIRNSAITTSSVRALTGNTGGSNFDLDSMSLMSHGDLA